MKLLIIWAAISVVAFIETIIMKLSITKYFKQRYGKAPKYKATLLDYMVSLIACMIPLYHIYLIFTYTFKADEIEVRTIMMMLISEMMDNEDNKE